MIREYKDKVTGNDYLYMSKGDRLLFKALFFIPLINAAADSTIYYFVDVNTGGLHSGIIRGLLILLFLAFFGFRRVLKTPVNILISVFLIYLAVLTFFSSRMVYSFTNGYLKWFVGLTMFPVGYYFFRRYESIVKLIFYLAIGASFVCLNLVVAQFTGFGISAYVENSFYIGGAGVGITNQLAFVLLTFPVLLRSRTRFSRVEKWFIYIVGVLSIVFVIVAMKRAGLIGLATGGAIFFSFTKSKKRVLKYVFLAALAIILTFPYYKDILLERYETRKGQTENYEEEGRYKEFFYVLEEFKADNPGQKLFGKEPFNTGQYFGVKYFSHERMIHGDFSSMFYGSGLVGIGLYLMLYGMILFQGINYFKKVQNNMIMRELMASYFSILCATFIISATGSGTIGEKCLVFLYLGAVSGYLAHYRPVANNGEIT